ncbi:MAG: hypothetical protein Kow0027_08760 [Saprospiraceae bacterium]
MVKAHVLIQLPLFATDAAMTVNRYPLPYKNLGATYLLMGDIDNALKYLHQGLQYATETDTDTLREIYTYLAECYNQKGDQVNFEKYSRLKEGLGGE